MSKKNTKNTSLEINNIDKNTFYINDTKVKTITKDMQKQLEVIRVSLSKIQVSLNTLVNKKAIKGNKADVYKGLAKKAKVQAASSEKLSKILFDKMNEDIQQYPIYLLDKRIEELENKIASLIKE